MRVTHHSNYVRFMEEARTAFLEAIGWGYDAWEERGIVSPVVSLSCEYKKPTHYMDEIAVDTEVLSVGAAVLKLAYTMTCSGAVVFTGQSVHCFLEDGKPVNIRKRFPAFCDALERGCGRGV